MKIAIRVDASETIGTGHVARCLTLADQMRSRGAVIRFISRPFAGNLIEFIERRGFEVDRLPADQIPPTDTTEGYAGWLAVPQEQDADQTAQALERSNYRPDWLVVDHYSIDVTWQRPLRSNVGAIMVIDDLADRPHDCDLLLDANLNDEGAERYNRLVPETCTVLSGPRYAMLRPEFGAAVRYLRSRDGSVRRILVFLGGMDRGGYTPRACRAILDAGLTDAEVDVIVGAASASRGQVKAFCERHKRFNYHCQINNIADLMNRADLAIGAGGTTTWERAWLGLPTIILPVAENQVPGSSAIASAGAAVMIPPEHLERQISLVETVRRVCDNPDGLVAMSRAARGLFGQSPVPGVELVARALEERISA